MRSYGSRQLTLEGRHDVQVTARWGTLDIKVSHLRISPGEDSSRPLAHLGTAASFPGCHKVYPHFPSASGDSGVKTGAAHRPIRSAIGIRRAPWTRDLPAARRCSSPLASSVRCEGTALAIETIASQATATLPERRPVRYEW